MSVDKTTLSIYTQLIVDEAEKLGLKVDYLNHLSRNLVILSHHDHQEVVSQSKTDLIGSATAALINHKMVANYLLSQLGLPVPDNLYTNQLAEAKKYLEEKGELVIKPLGRTGGIGITSHVTTEQELALAFEKAQNTTTSYEKMVICQEQLPGHDHRVTVINQRELFAVRREPAYVIADGQNNLETLIENWNQQLTVKTRAIKINNTVKDLIKKQELTLKSVPPEGEKIKLGILANGHQGGIVIDVTEQLCSQVKEIALKIAQHFSLPVVGIDFISPDISRDPGKIIELNSCPGLSLHHHPSLGQSRNPSRALVKMLFPEINDD